MRCGRYFMKRQPLGLMLDGAKLELCSAKAFTVELNVAVCGLHAVALRGCTVSGALPLAARNCQGR